MARKIRIEYAGAIYHVINRGDRQEAIFKDDADRLRFLESLGEACTSLWPGTGAERGGESRAHRARGVGQGPLGSKGLRQRAKGDPIKVVAIALRLRQETTMRLKWISQRLGMGAWTHLNKRLYQERQRKQGRKVE